jgi:hypothetical protein
MPALGWAMAAAPVLALAALLFLVLPEGPDTPDFSLVDESAFVEALGQWEASGLDLDEILDGDLEWDDLELNDEERTTFLDELENFDLEII